MVIIRLKAPFVSVIVTVLSTLAELALLSFLIVVNNLHECRQLKSGRSIQVRKHLTRTRVISFIALALFLVLEVVFSFYNDPVNNVLSRTHTCVIVSNSVLERGDSRDFLRAADVFVQCRTLQNGNLTQFGGNFSRQTEQVECSAEAMYTHSLDDRTVDESVVDVPFHCLAGAEGEICVFILQNDSRSLISKPFFRADLEFLPDVFSYLSTELHFKPPSNLTIFSDRAIKAFDDDIGGPAALRRIIYSGAREANCTFPVVDGTATTVPLAMLIALALTWSIPAFLLLAVLRLRKNIFFEIGNPMDWATRSVRSIEDPLGENPVLTGVEDEDGMLVQVSTSTKI